MSASGPAVRSRFPFRRLGIDALVVGVICIGSALIISLISRNSGSLGVNIVFSLVIGAIALLLIDGPRLLFWGEHRSPSGLAFFGIVLAAVPVAQFGGTMLAGWLTGVPTPGLQTLITSGANKMVLFTLIMTGGAAAFLHHNDRLRRAEAEAEREKARSETIARQAMQAQLQLLQAQIEPHMLFNTLANLQGLIAIDPARAQQMLDQLIQYLRASLQSSRAELSTLDKEFALLEAYLGLMAVRMGTRLSFSLHLPPELRAQCIPPMLLQPLVENAIIHGLEPKVEGGHVRVSAAHEGDLLAIAVADSGLGLDAGASEAGTQVGVANTRARLLALYGERACLELLPNKPHGALARLTLPMEDA